jgi:hypothetical protein
MCERTCITLKFILQLVQVTSILMMINVRYLKEVVKLLDDNINQIFSNYKY